MIFEPSAIPIFSASLFGERIVQNPPGLPLNIVQSLVNSSVPLGSAVAEPPPIAMAIAARTPASRTEYRMCASLPDSDRVIRAERQGNETTMNCFEIR